jgi:fumarylacetoacetase
LDIKLELGMFVCKGNKLGDRIGVSEAEDSIFGYLLMNDWSARDIQMWAYVPLGPFNAKNFGTTISPWVVLTDALKPFAAPSLENNTPRQDYLHEKEVSNVFDINLEVDLTSFLARILMVGISDHYSIEWQQDDNQSHRREKSHLVFPTNARSSLRLGVPNACGRSSGIWDD